MSLDPASLGIPQLIQLVLAGLGIWIARLHLLPSLRLLARTVHRRNGPIGSYVSASWDLVSILIIVGLREKLYRAARLTIEWELLHPRPGRPSSDQPSAAALATANRHWLRVALPAWRQQRRRRLASLLEPHGDGAPAVEVPDVFRIERAREGIEHYFDTLASESSIVVDARTRFISTLRVQDGFLAPLHLVAGLNARLDEDWGRILAPYRDLEFEGGDVASFVAFQFVCWLAWGPSIPVCTCHRWQGWRDRPVFQYGFGDESNSLPVLIEEGGAAGAFDPGGGNPQYGMVMQATLRGVLHWGPGIQANELCPLQQDLRSPDEERLVLRCARMPATTGGDLAKASARYYSAYLWMMFVVELADSADSADAGRPASPDDGPAFDRPWSRMLPFFEHGNLADGETLAALKERLAGKVAAFLADHPDVRLRYVCAVDDAMCFEEGRKRPARFPVPEWSTLRARLARRIGAQHPALAGSDVLMARPGVPWSSCTLPEVIGGFVDRLENGAPGHEPQDGDPR